MTSVHRERSAGARPAPPDPGERHEANIAELAVGWIATAGSQVKTTAELALAEARLAALSVVLMLMLGIIAAVFVLGAWGMLMAGAVTGLVELGIPLWAALLGIGALHVVFAWLLLRWMARLSIHLELPATRRQLSGGDERDRPHDLA